MFKLKNDQRKIMRIKSRSKIAWKFKRASASTRISLSLEQLYKNFKIESYTLKALSSAKIFIFFMKPLRKPDQHAMKNLATQSDN